MRDPLRLACGRILSRALFFLPARRVLFSSYADLAELNADATAVRARPGGRAALASALLAFEATRGIPPDRGDFLLGRAVGWRRPWRLVTASIATVTSLTAVTLGASPAASLQATFNLPLLSPRPASPC